MALASVRDLTFSYPNAGACALDGVSLEVATGEIVALLGPSGSGKSTLLRALAGLVPHFHGGRFSGAVVVAGRDTRHARPSDLAGSVATVFQDPEDQVVMSLVANDVAFGLENLGVAPDEIWPRVHDALALLDAAPLRRRATGALSGGELQRVCLAGALALEPALLLLDEPMSQLDAAAARRLLEAIAEGGAAVVLAEHRVERALAVADRVVFLERGRIVLDAPRDDAASWLADHRPLYAPRALERDATEAADVLGEELVGLEAVRFAYPGAATPALADARLELRRGEVVALEGPNGSGKTTLAKIAAGLLEPQAGTVRKRGRASYLLQDPGRYLVRERVVDEVALAVGGDLRRAAAELDRFGLGWAADRHPRDLSSGERERVALAAVAVSEPDVLVLDEPTRGVDPVWKAAIGEWLLAYAGSGRSVLVATHDRSLPAHRRIVLGAEALVAV